MSLFRAAYPWAGRGTRSRHNPEQERRALEVWRSRHSLVSRLAGLWTGGREDAAIRLASHTERWYGNRTPAGERWPYQWLIADVVRWPRIQEPRPGARVRVLERRRVERAGYEVCTWQARTGEWIAEANLESGQVLMVGGKSEKVALRYLAGVLGLFVEEALMGKDAQGNGQ